MTDDFDIWVRLVITFTEVLSKLPGLGASGLRSDASTYLVYNARNLGANTSWLL